MMMMNANDANEEEVVCHYNSENQDVPDDSTTTVIVGKKVTYIKEGAFQNLECLKIVDMSGAYSLEYIGEGVGVPFPPRLIIMYVREW